MNEYQWFAVGTGFFLMFCYILCLVYYYTGKRAGAYALKRARNEGRSTLRYIIEGRDDV
tara:strand:- start:701 stop:877 length:177 start_codon:yes stop_codon:yes gene_type:complete